MRARVRAVTLSPETCCDRAVAPRTLLIARPTSRGQSNGRPGSARGGPEKSLRETVRQVLLSDVVRMDGGGNGSSSDAWRVMVLDARATRVISSVVGMYDIMEGHVTVVEDLHKVCVRACVRVLCVGVG